MNEDLIADLKQFIAATVSQATADLPTRADLAALATKADLRALRSDMNDRFGTLEAKVTTIADAHAEQLENHEHRLNRL